MSKKSFKNNLLALVATGALIVAQPDIVRADSLISGFYVQLEGRLSISDGDDMPYAVNPFSGRIFTTDLVDTQDDNNARYGMGLNIGQNIDVGLFYSGLNIRGEAAPYTCASAATPCIAPLAGNGISNAYTYAGLLGHNYESVETETTYHVVDFEVGYSMQLGQVALRGFVGVRYADFDQNISGTGHFYPGIPTNPNFSFERHVHAVGIGPRLGVEGNIPLGSTNFGLAGGINGAILFGDRDTVDSTIAGGFAFTETSRLIDDGDDTMYNVEGDLGFTYGIELGNASSMMLTAGYRVEAWFNVNNAESSFTGPGIGPLPAGAQYGEDDDGQLFHGPFLRAKLNF